MKMKRLLVYLSALAILQIIFMSTVSTFLEELFGDDTNQTRQLLALATALTTFMIIVIMYKDLFNKTAKTK